MPEIRAYDLCSVSVKDNLIDVSRTGQETGVTENQATNHCRNK